VLGGVSVGESLGSKDNRVFRVELGSGSVFEEQRLDPALEEVSVCEGAVVEGGGESGSGLLVEPVLPVS